MRGEKCKEKNRATGEGLRREMSKCLFMPNWATDEPAAISDNSLCRRKEETSMKGGKEIGNSCRGQMLSVLRKNRWRK